MCNIVVSVYIFNPKGLICAFFLTLECENYGALFTLNPAYDPSDSYIPQCGTCKGFLASPPELVLQLH